MLCSNSWGSNTFSKRCPTFRISRLFCARASHLIATLKFHDYALSKLCSRSRSNISECHTQIYIADVNDVARFRVCVQTEIPDVSGKTVNSRNQTNRNPSSRGAGLSTFPREKHLDGATRHVHHRRRSSPVLLSLLKKKSSEWPRLRDFAFDILVLGRKLHPDTEIIRSLLAVISFIPNAWAN